MGDRTSALARRIFLLSETPVVYEQDTISSLVERVDVPRTLRCAVEGVRVMTKHPTIWIDFENTPHVPLFLPIILELEREGCEVILTARDFAQTIDLAEGAGLTVTIVGHESGRATWQKGLALSSRAARLAWAMRGKGIALAVGHGS